MYQRVPEVSVLDNSTIYLLDDFQDKSQRANTPFSRQITTATANELLEDTLPYPWLANEFCSSLEYKNIRSAQFGM